MKGEEGSHFNCLIEGRSDDEENSCGSHTATHLPHILQNVIRKFIVFPLLFPHELSQRLGFGRNMMMKGVS